MLYSIRKCINLSFTLSVVEICIMVESVLRETNLTKFWIFRHLISGTKINPGNLNFNFRSLITEQIM
jgi:hypothetical protein